MHLHDFPPQYTMVEPINHHSINPHRFEAFLKPKSDLYAPRPGISDGCFAVFCRITGARASIMVRRNIDTATKSKAVHLLRTHWRPDAVAEKSRCSLSTAYRWEQRLLIYGAPADPYRLRTGRPRSIPRAAVESLLQYQKLNP